MVCGLDFARDGYRHNSGGHASGMQLTASNRSLSVRSPGRPPVHPRLYHVFPPYWPVRKRQSRRIPAGQIYTPRQLFIPGQLAIIFPLQRRTPLTERVLSVIYRIARTGGGMPDNPSLGEMAGGHGRHVVYRVLTRLERAGLIYIEKEALRRRIYVVELDRWTGWGISRPGHAPFSATPRSIWLGRRAGMAPLEVEPEEQTSQFPRLPSLHDIEIPRVGTCQMIIEDAQSLGGEPKFCGLPVLRGKSWCPQHHAELTRPFRVCPEQCM